MGIIIDGKQKATEIRAKMANKIGQIKELSGITIGLAAVVVGNDGGSAAYIKNIARVCSETGVSFKLLQFDDITEMELVDLINKLNADNAIHGLIVQLPLPKHINQDLISRTIALEKDVDCFNPVNMGKLFRGEKCLLPCTPKGIVRLLDEYNIDISGKKVAVVGRSNIVGKPAAMLMLSRNATVTICHSRTTNLEEELMDKDIIISAVGVPGIIKESMVKDKAVIIDAGTTYVEGLLKGDVDFEGVIDKASHITPVPGGVGAMTTTMLIENVLEASGYYE